MTLLKYWKRTLAAGRLIPAAAALGGLLVLGCSVAACVRICMMERMLCSSALFRAKLHK